MPKKRKLLESGLTLASCQNHIPPGAICVSDPDGARAGGVASERRIQLWVPDQKQTGLVAPWCYPR
jgi:hypothetical protein